MTTSLRPNEVRNLVQKTLRQFWAGDEELATLEENILIQEGRYYARSYQMDGFMAMWMIDVGILQFYDEEGNMLMTVNLFQEERPQRMAA